LENQTPPTKLLFGLAFSCVLQFVPAFAELFAQENTQIFLIFKTKNFNGTHCWVAIGVYFTTVQRIVREILGALLIKKSLMA
jgi:hypothetical protein